MLHVAIAQTNPKKKDGLYITEDFIDYYKHLLFNSIQAVKTKFKGEIILALDSRNYWRRDFYPEYKQHRKKDRDKSEINYTEFYSEVDKVLDSIRENFPFKVLEVDKAEADDIAGVITERNPHLDIVLVTSDHDWAQTLHHNHVTLWDPIKKDFQSLTDYEKEYSNTPVGRLMNFVGVHSLVGDAGDNVPKLTEATILTDVFITHLKNNDVYITDIMEFNKLDNKDSLIESFDIFKITKSGKNKGKATDVKDIYKQVPFGVKKAEKFLTNMDLHLAEHPMYKDNFIRNNTLVDFDKIPSDLKDNIQEAFKSADYNYNTNGIMNYFIENNLGELLENVSRFYDDSIESKSSLDDFF